MKAWAEWTPQTCRTVPPTVQWIQKRGSRVLRMPGSTHNPLSSAPAGLTWLPTPSSHSWCRWCVLLLFLGVGTNTGWDECPLPFLDSASLHLLSTLSKPSARSLTADASSAGVNICQMSSLLLATAVLSARWFPLYAPFSSNRSASSDISLPLRAPCLSFYKGLSCVLSSNPFKIPCTFLNDGNPLTRRGRWESWEWHQRGLLNLLWQQGRDARTCFI